VLIFSFRGSEPTGDVSHKFRSRLPLLSTRPVVTFPASGYHCSLAGINLDCLVNRGTCDSGMAGIKPEMEPGQDI